MSDSGYVFRRTLKLLGGDGVVVRGDGWAGTPYWLAQEKGAAEPVLTKGMERRVEPKSLASILRKHKRGNAYAGSVDMGLVQDRRGDHKAFVRAMRHHENRWPYLVNAHFVEHVANCWPHGDWHILATGTLLRVVYRGERRATVRGIVMCIRPFREIR